MDTNDPYFWPGDEEIQVWVVPPAYEPVTRGYVKGQFNNESGIMFLGVLRDHGTGKLMWTEEVIQKMAESMMDQGFIFFYLRVVTTTSFDDDLSAEVKGKYEKIAQEHELMAKGAEDRVTGAGDYDRGVADGVRMVMEHGPFV